MELATICSGNKDSVISFIKERLNDDQQKIFAEHFLLQFMEYDDPFPIDGESAMKWLEYDMKHKFKAFLQKHLEIETEYQILLTHTGEKSRGRSHDNETFKISVEGFKKLGIKANTNKGERIRDYYFEIEKLIYLYGIHQQKMFLEDAESKLKAANERAQNLQFALEAEKDNMARYENRRVKKHEPGHVVYLGVENHVVMINNEAHNQIKVRIGECKDQNNREQEYRTENSSLYFAYSKKCCDKKLLERLVHHILDQYRIWPKREWFQMPFATAKYVLDCAQLFLDGLVDKCENLETSGLYEALKKIIDDLPEQPSGYVPPPVQIDKAQPPSEIKPINVEIGSTVNPYDFDQFIKDNCTIDEANTEFAVDIEGAHRLWARTSDKQVNDALYKYMCEHYKKVKVYDPTTNAKLSSYKGLKLKPCTYKKDDPPCEIDSFVEERCIVGYSERLQTSELYKEFENWKQTIDTDYKITPNEKRRVDHWFANHFLNAKVYNGQKSVLGHFGVSIKDSEMRNVGKKLTPKLKKAVVKIDIQTKKVVEEYDSLTAAAKVIGKSPAYVSMDIRFKKPVGNFIYQFKDTIESV